MPGYRDYEAQQLVNTALQGPQGAAFMRSLGITKDFYAARARQAVKMRFPSFASTDALGAIGDERLIDRGPTETDAAYAARLRDAWNAWTFGGTAFGLLTALTIQGYAPVVMNSSFQNTLDGNGNLVQVATAWRRDLVWNNFTLILPHPWPTRWLSAGNWAAPVIVGTGSGTVSSVSGVAAPDTDYVILVSTGGAAGVGQYKVSTDHGVTFGAATTIAATGNVLGTGVTFSAAGTFTLNDRYYLSQVPQGDSSNDANVVRRIVSRWKSAVSTCTAIIVLQSGRLIGYPVRTLGSSNGVLGGASFTNWTPPT